MAGVIGRAKFSYDLWGDTVNTARRLESLGQPGAVLLSEDTKQLLAGDYGLIGPRSLAVPGKGELSTWLLQPDPA